MLGKHYLFQNLFSGISWLLTYLSLITIYQYVPDHYLFVYWILIYIILNLFIFTYLFLNWGQTAPICSHLVTKNYAILIKITRIVILKRQTFNIIIVVDVQDLSCPIGKMLKRVQHDKEKCLIKRD